MHPTAWRKKKGLTLRQVAKLLERSSASVVLRWETGELEAPNSVALAYERISKRAVTAEDLNRVRKAFLASSPQAA